jgi:hypothetical protein
MTAFEIIMTNFFDVIEKNAPQKNQDHSTEGSHELTRLVRQYIKTSYDHGHQLAYRNMLADLSNRISDLLTGASYSEWERLRLALIGNDLHVIRRDRPREAVAQLKTRLIRHI